LILTNFQGKIYLKDLIQCNLNFIADPDYDAGFDLVMDFSQCIAIGYRMDLLEYIDFFKKTIRLEKRIRVGIVYTSPNTGYLVGIYKPIARLMKMDVEGFRQLGPCLQWMNFGEQDQQRIADSLEAIRNNAPETIF
jgi:hypothetical protein